MTATRSESLKHLLTVILGADEHDKPWMLIYEHHKCRTLLAFDRLSDAQLREDFDWDPAKGTTYQQTKLDQPEIDDLNDLKEWVRHNRTAVTADWLLKVGWCRALSSSVVSGA